MNRTSLALVNNNSTRGSYCVSFFPLFSWFAFRALSGITAIGHWYSFQWRTFIAYTVVRYLITLVTIQTFVTMGTLQSRECRQLYQVFMATKAERRPGRVSDACMTEYRRIVVVVVGVYSHGSLTLIPLRPMVPFGPACPREPCGSQHIIKQMSNHANKPVNTMIFRSPRARAPLRFLSVCVIEVALFVTASSVSQQHVATVQSLKHLVS